MQFSQYCRIETAAGGVGCTPRQFIKAAHGLLSPKGKNRQSREARHAWLREGLAMLGGARDQYNCVMSGSW